MSDNRSHRRLQDSRNRRRCNVYVPHERQLVYQIFDAEQRRRRNSTFNNNSNNSITLRSNMIPQLQCTLNAPAPMTEGQMLEILSRDNIGTEEKGLLVNSMAMFLSILAKFSQLSLPSEALLDNKENCSVCLSLIDGSTYIRTLLCGHTFHSACVDKWLQEHLTCPLCRRGILGNTFEIKEMEERQGVAQPDERQPPLQLELESPLSPILAPRSDDSWRELGDDDSSDTSFDSSGPDANATQNTIKEEEEVPAKRPKCSIQVDDDAGPSSSSWHDEQKPARTSTPIHHSNPEGTVHDDSDGVIEPQIIFSDVSFQEDVTKDRAGTNVSQHNSGAENVQENKAAYDNILNDPEGDLQAPLHYFIRQLSTYSVSEYLCYTRVYEMPNPREKVATADENVVQQPVSNSDDNDDIIVISDDED